jgi:HEXXH motif-containing protein
VTRHTLPAAAFDELARGAGGIGGVLRAGQRSKRLLLLHELARAAERGAPRLHDAARTGRTYAQLADAQRRDRHAADRVLLHPHVGAWAMHCLRRLAGDGSLRPEDLGHLGAVTAAAALRAGLAFDVVVHARDGAVVLPTFGMGRVAPSATWCRLRAGARTGAVEVADGTGVRRWPLDGDADADRDWSPLRRLRSSAGGLTVDLELDDLDPFRDCGALPPAPRLSGTELAEWQAKLDDGWALLVADDPEQADAISQGVVTLVPLQPTDAVSELSASRHEAIGAVALTAPRRPLSMVLALVHEFQHNKLSALLDLFPLVEPAPERLFPAPWRRDPRPVRGLLHGTYAFFGLARFWDRHRDGSPTTPGRTTAHPDWAHFEFALLRDEVAATVAVLRRSGLLTPEGTLFVDGMRRGVRALRTREVRSRPWALARLARLDNAVSWRLRNREADADRLRTWAAAWVDGRSCPPGPRPGSRVVDGGGALASEARTALFRAHLAHPERWRADIDDPIEADLLLLRRQDRAAAQAYRLRIAKDPDDLASWAGLALCRGTPAPTRWALTICPELLRGLHAAAAAAVGGSPDVDDLAAWMARGVPVGPIWAG